MQKVLLRIPIVTLITILMAPNLIAMKIYPAFTFQGQLLNDDGTPANGIFDMQLSIYDIPNGGTPLWQESHSAVAVNEGLFSIVVGEIDSLSADVMVSESDTGEFAVRYLEIQVEADPPMIPRTRLLASPYSVASSRIAGDIFTSPGSIRMGIEPQPFNPSIEIQALSDHSSLAMTAPGQDGGAGLEITNPMVQLSADSIGPAVTLKRIFDSGGTTDSSRIHLATNFYNSIFEMSGPGWGNNNAIKMHANGDIPSAFIMLSSPPPSSSVYPNVTIFTEESGGSVIVREPLDYMTYLLPRSIYFYNYNTGAIPLKLSAVEGSYFMNNVGIGTSGTGNILTVEQSSVTDPIADAWTVYSSRRWKENIKPIENALEKVESLRGVSFDWKADGKHDIGLVAEEVGDVIPEVVAYEENGVDAQSVDYARLVAVLIEAVKEQQAEIEDLKNRLDRVESKAALLEKSGDSKFSSIERQAMVR